MGPLGIFDFWATEEIPAPLRGKNSLQGKPTRLEPLPNGTLFRLFEIQPTEKNLSLDQAEKKHRLLLLRPMLLTAELILD